MALPKRNKAQQPEFTNASCLSICIAQRKCFLDEQWCQIKAKTVEAPEPVTTRQLSCLIGNRKSTEAPVAIFVTGKFLSDEAPKSLTIPLCARFQ